LAYEALSLQPQILCYPSVGAEQVVEQVVVFYHFWLDTSRETGGRCSKQVLSTHSEMQFIRASYVVLEFNYCSSAQTRSGYTGIATSKPSPKPTLLFTTRRLPTSNHQFRHLIRSIQHLLLISNLARSATIARRYIQRWIPGEEIPWSEQQCHGFCGHDGEIFRGGEMRDAKCVPEDDVGVVD
jgi:hypothetical protein